MYFKMEDFFNGLSKIMEDVDLVKRSYSNDVEDVLKRLNTIVSKCKEKENDKTPNPKKKKLKRANAPFEKIEDGNTSTIQSASRQSYRLPRTGKGKLSQTKQASTSIRQKEPTIEIELLSDDLNDPKKSINTKIKKEKLKKSPQTRRVTRASSRNQNLTINSYTEGISVNESVEIIPEETSLITLSDQDGDTKEKSLQEILNESEKRITRSKTKSLKKSSSPEKNNISVNTSSENVSLMDSNNNGDENNKNNESGICWNNNEADQSFLSKKLTLPRISNKDELTETSKGTESICKDQATILEKQDPRSETFTCDDIIPANTTSVQPLVPEVTGESTFVVNRKENNENKTPLVETEKTFILPKSEAEKFHNLNPNSPMVSKGEEPVPESRVPVATSIDSKQIGTVILKPKNTGAVPKHPSKDIKDAGINKKIAACTVLLKKPNLNNKLYKRPITQGKPNSAKAPSREYKNIENKKAVSQITSKNQSPNLMQIQQEKEFLRRLEKKRLEIEEKDKQKLARQIAMEQQIKKSVKAIQEKKLQIAQNNQNEDLQKKAYNFNTLNSDDSTDDEHCKSTKKCDPPMWSKHFIRKERIECQNFVPVKIIDSFFSVAPLNPDMREIFPEINPVDLKRNSSIFWRTPPRYSQLPKY